MSESLEVESFPRGPLLGAAVMVGLALTVVTATRVTGNHAAAPQPATLISHDLRFQDRADGGIDIYDAAVAQPFDVILPGTNGFLRGTMRGLARQRKREGIGADVPFRLFERVDGHLMLEDPTTNRVLDLGGFGPTNAAAFADVLKLAEDAHPTLSTLSKASQ